MASQWRFNWPTKLITISIFGSIVALPPLTWVSTFGVSLVILSAWQELLCLVLGVILLAWRPSRIRFKKLLKTPLGLAITAYCLLFLIYGAFAQSFSVWIIGTALDLRFLLFFALTYCLVRIHPIIRKQFNQRFFMIMLIVALIAIAQVVLLPNNLLTHIGYDPLGVSHTYVPNAYTILTANSKIIRPQSLLRGPNPLGALLIMPICLLLVRLRQRPAPRYVASLVLLLIALFLTESRSAWLGLIVAAAVLIALSVTGRARNLLLVASGIGLVIIISLVFIFHNSSLVQRYLLHQSHSYSSTTSHASATKAGLEDVIHHPLGHGPGTAGPLSASHGTDRIAENYYLQVGEEVGWLGLLLFVIITALTGWQLWQHRQSQLALSLFASFTGLFVVAMLSHIWTDDAVSFVWWGLAGIALAYPPKSIELEDA